MVNSIQKGKRFERETAKMLSKATGAEWKRVPQSGAFSTVNRSDDPRFFGDVFAEHENYNDLVVECKSYKNFSINDLFNYKSKFWKWVSQARQESKGLHWLLFFKIDNKGVFVTFNEEHAILTIGRETENQIRINNTRVMKIK